jgi:NADH/NAD ratio-sensing transcriptional regulator Rex
MVPNGEVELPRSLLQDILKDVKLHSDVVRILCRNGRAIFDASFDSKGFTKELSDNGQDVKISCKAGEEVNACFEISSILPMVKERVTKSDSLTLRIGNAAMIVQLLNEEGFKVQYFVAPCKVEEAAPTAINSKKVDAEAQLKDLTERIDRLTSPIDSKSTNG